MNWLKCGPILPALGRFRARLGMYIRMILTRIGVYLSRKVCCWHAPSGAAFVMHTWSVPTAHKSVSWRCFCIYMQCYPGGQYRVSGLLNALRAEFINFNTIVVFVIFRYCNDPSKWSSSTRKTWIGYLSLLVPWLRHTERLAIMMTSSKGNMFRVTGPLWGESTGHRWIPLTKTSDAVLWCFLWSVHE